MRRLFGSGLLVLSWVAPTWAADVAQGGLLPFVGSISVERYSSLAAAIADIGFTTRTLLVPNVQTVTANVTVPPNITLWFLGSGQLSINSGVTVTITGPVIAPPMRIFTGAGATPGVKLANGAVEAVDPRWWGARGDGVTDDSTALHAALNALPAGGGIVRLVGGLNFLYTTGLTLGVGQSIRGAGIPLSTLTYGGNAVAITVTSDFLHVYSALSGFTLTTPAGVPVPGAGTHGIRLQRVVGVTLSGLRVRGFSTAGVHFSAPSRDDLVISIIIDQCEVDQNRDGILATGVHTVMNHVTIINSRIRANTGYNIYVVPDVRNWTLLGNVFESGSPYALHFRFPVALTIHGNYFEQTGANGGIHVDATHGTLGGIAITANHIQGGGATTGGIGINLGTTAFVRGIDIAGNLLNNWQTAINPAAVINGRIGPNLYIENGTTIGTPGPNVSSLEIAETFSESPAPLTATQHDYHPSLAKVWRLSSTAPQTITGLAAGWDGRTLLLINVGTQNIVLQNQHAGSAAANRIITGTGADLTLGTDDTATLLYDRTTDRWRVTNAQ